MSKTIKVGQTVQAGAWSVHRFSGSIVATDTTNAQKRGKVCPVFKCWDRLLDDRNAYADVFGELILALAEKGATAEQMLEAARECGCTDADVREERGVDVVRDRSFTCEKFDVSWNENEVSVADHVDRNNLPAAYSRKRSGARKACAWLDEHLQWLGSHDFRTICAAIERAGANLHHYCRMD